MPVVCAVCGGGRMQSRYATLRAKYMVMAESGVSQAAPADRDTLAVRPMTAATQPQSDVSLLSCYLQEFSSYALGLVEALNYVHPWAL